ncbi:MAG: DEAD/DEAH box helicase, partial [Verrucomicrobiaceae bacterium]|nr:DEAD/DEAH box helicase [Verrucomicrobiaceae bacterium]
VAEEVAKLAAFKRGIRELPIYGGASYERQFRGLKGGAQIIIGTPGRVIDHLERKTLSLEHVGFVVLDEADRMLDMGFREDMENILSQARPDRQTVLFSATLPPAIQQMVRKFTRNPAQIRIESQTLTVPAIEQCYYEVDRRSKLEVLCRILDLQDIKYALIFCATKAMVDELTEHLVARGYTADRLHGDMAQTMRERVMRRFRDRKVEILVATDVAARGLDVDDIEVVFNYDLPHDAEDYVHRIGRTGRAGRAGRAITFVAGRELWKLQQFMRVTRGRIERKGVPSQSEVEQRQANRLFETLREVLDQGDYKRSDALIDELLEAGHNATDIISALLHLLSAETTRAAQPITEDQPRSPRREYPRYEERAPRSYGRTDDFRPEFRDDRRPAGGVREERGRENFAARGPRRDFRDEPDAHSHEPGMVRLSLNLGGEQMVGPGDVVGFIANTANITRGSIGAIHILPRRTMVDIAEAEVEAVLRLNGMRFKGRKLAIAPAERMGAA